ncbi:hypothetical protein DP939_04525 [Spongiactinospora rosea]|uniref:Lipocalin-like domain-containing protein n=1 Tax=Spongiactinospora rosea TaxID=2248750 RepID=A0A366M8Z5_9ACTN|nr:hypothetical protein [Spongiactinospora rosea]RBQ21942.1 hypothetical protein DP939_04525 [Spongiactinospora rosea]
MSTETGETNIARALEGRWYNVYTEVDGEPVDQADSIIEMRGNEFTIEQDGNVTYRGTYRVGPAFEGNRSQYHITLIYSESINPLFLGGPRPGLFQICGETLTTVFAGVGQQAPRQFITHRGSESVLTRYRLEGAKRLNPRERGVTLFGGNSIW